jgi:MtrB/PioB family decaheme-associated outer membrane protein
MLRRVRDPGVMAVRLAGIPLAPLTAAAALWSAAGFGQAAPDMSQWRCRLCPFEQGTQAQYTAGTAYVSDDAARFGDGNGYDEQGAYLLANGDGRHADDNQRITWRFDNLGLDARSLSLDGNRGWIDYRLRYRELPHYLFDTASTVFREDGTGRLVLPATWVRAPATSQMSALGASLAPVGIGSQRDRLDLGIELRPRDAFAAYADYERQERTGTTISGASFFNTTSQLPRPIDQSIDELTLGLRYLTGHGTLNFAYRGSFFDNALSALTWDNPFTSAPGAGQGSFAESPDNSYQSLSIDGAFRFRAHTALTFSAGRGRGEQNESLLPYTINSELAASVLPRTTLDGAVDTSHVALTASTRVGSRIRLKTSYRYDEHDNRTPIDVWTRVITDSFMSTDSESNVAYDFKRRRLNLVANADVSSRLELSAGYDHTTLDRSEQEVAGQTTDGGWGRLRWRFAPGFELSLRRGTEERDVDRYDTALASELLQNPVLAKYNLAYRYRTYADATFTAAGSQRPFTVALSTFYADDDYTRSRIGITSDKDRRIAADFGWTFTPRVSFFASASSETIDARQSGSESFALPDWTAAHSDRFRTLSSGLRLDQIPPRFDLTIDASVANSGTAIDLTRGTIGDTLPDLRSRLDALRVKAVYHHSSRLSIPLELRYEHLDTDDWALAGVDPATIAGVLGLGADPFRYNVVVIGAGATYRFDR